MDGQIQSPGTGQQLAEKCGVFWVAGQFCELDSPHFFMGKSTSSITMFQFANCEFTGNGNAPTFPHPSAGSPEKARKTVVLCCLENSYV